MTTSIEWIGTVLILVAYFLISNEMIDGQNKYYQLMNLSGAICIGINVYAQRAWPVLGLEIAWGGIAGISLIKILG